MWRLRILIKSISKQGIKYKLVFFQLIIVFIALNFAFSLINKNLDVKININKLIDKNKSALLRISINSKDTNPIETVNNIYDELSNNKTIDKIGSYYICQNTIDNTQINTVFLNKGGLDLYNITVNKGSNKIFNSYYNENEIPILITNDLSTKWNIDSLINIKLSQNNEFKDFKFKVVGVINKDTYFWNSKIGNKSSITSLKNSIIIPFDKEYFYDDGINFSMKSSHTVVLSKTPEFLDEFLGSLSETTYDNSNLDYIKVNELITQIYDQSKPWIIMTLIFAFLLSVLSFIGFIGVITNYITFRKREYGIRFALGSTKSELLKLVCGEVTLSLIVSNLISVFIIVLANYITDMDLNTFLIIKSIIPSFLISLIIFFVTALTYKHAVLNKNIVDLMRGN